MKSEKVTIADAKHFASYADSILNGIKSLYMPSEEVLIEPASVENAPKQAGTLEVHKVRRRFNRMVYASWNFIIPQQTYHRSTSSVTERMVTQRFADILNCHSL